MKLTYLVHKIGFFETEVVATVEYIQDVITCPYLRQSLQGDKKRMVTCQKRFGVALYQNQLN